jgi:hypothetical protein
MAFVNESSLYNELEKYEKLKSKCNNEGISINPTEQKEILITPFFLFQVFFKIFMFLFGLY